ncbi:uncharacterized protein LOC116409446 [Xenopus tropicalis]|nr:uncharacterized protein LOC116409446 [Xenopus tropicalis]
MAERAAQLWGCLLVHLLVPGIVGDPSSPPFPTPPAYTGNGTLDKPAKTMQLPGGNQSGPVLCPSITTPLNGSVHVAEGTGRSVGSLVLFQCKEGFQLIGSMKLKCLLRGDKPQWSEAQPECEVVPRQYHRGFRLAVIVSLFSCLIILTTCAFFMLCCVKETQLRQQEEETISRGCQDRDEAPNFPGLDESGGRSSRNLSSPERPLQGLLSSACLRGGARLEHRTIWG